LFGEAGTALSASTDRPWQLATPDRYVWSHAAPVSAPLECKSWADADRKSWEAGPPPAVRAQLVQQMDVLDSSTGYWAVIFLPSGRFQCGVIEHDPAVIPDGPDVDHPCPVCQDIRLIRDAGYEFYRRMILELPPPDLDSSAATLAALRARFTPMAAKQAEIGNGTYQKWLAACDLIDEYKEMKREQEIIMRSQAGEATELTVDGEVVAKRLVFDSAVKAHTRHMDYYRRVAVKKEDSK
jgi:hypothetical protein